MTGAHQITRQQEDIWLSAKCSCGQGSHLTTSKSQVTAWINRHLKKAGQAS